MEASENSFVVIDHVEISYLFKSIDKKFLEDKNFIHILYYRQK